MSHSHTLIETLRQRGYRVTPQREMIVEALKRRFGEDLVSVVLFGPFARGDFHERSDIDLLILCKKVPKSRMERLKKFEKVEDKITKLAEKLGIENLEINPIITTLKKIEGNPILLDLMRSSKILYDKDARFSKYLSLLRKKIEDKIMFREGYWMVKGKASFDELLRK